MLRNLIEQFNRKRIGSRRKRHRPPRRRAFDRGLSRGLRLESLENRNLLAAVIIAESDGFTSVAEGGATDTFDIALDSIPTAAVDFTVTTDFQTEVSINGFDFFSSVMFSRTETNPQTITVRAIDDMLAQGTRVGSISISLATTDADFAALPPIPDVSVSIEDNDIRVRLGQETSENVTLILNDPNSVRLFSTDGSGPTFIFSNLGFLEIVGSPQDNQLTIDYRNGDPLSVISHGLSFDGGANQQGGDALAIIGSGAEAAVYAPSSFLGKQGHDGAITVDGRTITFTGLEPVDIFGMATATLLTPPSSNDTLTLTNGTGFMLPGDAIRVSGTVRNSAAGATDGVPIETVAFGDNGQVIIDTSSVFRNDGQGMPGGPDIDGDDRVIINSADNAHNNLNLTIITGTGNDDVDVNGAVTLSGSGSTVRVQTQSISLGGPIVAANRISLDAGAGAITNDSVDLAPLLRSMAGELLASAGIGSNNDINSELRVLAVENSQTGEIRISNNSGGLLTLGIVGAIAGVTNNAPGGIVQIRNAGPIAITHSVLAIGDIAIVAHDSEPAGGSDNLVVNTGASVTSANGRIDLRAGDDLTLFAGSVISAANGAIAIVVDDPGSDPDAGPSDIGSTVTLGAANVLVSANGTTITGGDDNDRFNIVPQIASDVYIVGGPAESLGDGLNFDLTGLIDVVLDLIPTTTGMLGVLNATGKEAVRFINIESLGTTGGSFDVRVRMDLSNDVSQIAGPIAAGIGTGLGDDGNADAITALASGANLRLNVESDVDGLDVLTSVQLLAASVTRLEIVGSADDDQLIIDFDSGSPIPANGIAFTAGAGFDRLDINQGNFPSGSVETVTHVFANETDGSVRFDLNGNGVESIITYTGLDPLTDNLKADNRIFQFADATPAGEIITLSNAVDLPDSSQIDSTASAIVTFTNPNNSLRIQTAAQDGSGTDTVQVEGLGAGFNADLTIETDCDDTVTFQSATTNLGSGGLTVTAGKIDILAGIITDGGAVAMNACDDIRFTAGGSVVALGDGEVTIAADSDNMPIGTGGALSMADGAVIDAGSGTLSLSADENILLSRVVTTNNVSIRTAGSITTAPGMAAFAHVSGGQATLDGDVAPGNSPGQLVVDGDVLFTAGNSFVVELDGTAGPGAVGGHDQLQVIGTGRTVALNASTLQLLRNFAPSQGDTFSIIDNVDPTSRIVGNFAGLANGAIFIVDGTELAISYEAGSDNNDVLLTVLAPPSAPDLVDASDSGSSNSDNLTNVDTPTFTGTAAPSVTVALQSDLAGELGTTTADGNGIWTFTVSSDSPLPENVHQITASVGSLTSNALQIVIDKTAPDTLSFTRQNPPASPTNLGSLVFRVAFDEDVTGVDTADVSVSGGSTAMVVGVSPVDARNYDVTVSGGDLGEFSGTVGIDLSIAQNITDLAGNNLLAGEPAIDETYLLDNIAPVPVISVLQTSPTNADSIVFLVDFGELVNGFVLGDIVAVNGTANNFLDAGGGMFTFSVTPVADGNVCVDIAIGVAQDAAGNLSNAATQFCIISDRTSPTSAILFPADDGVFGPDTWTDLITGTTNDATAGVSTVSVSIEDLTTSQFWNDTTFASTAEQFLPAVGTTSWSFAFSDTNLIDGRMYRVSGRAADNAGNVESIPAATFTFDSLAPVPTISGAASPIADSSFDVMIDFGEPVNGFSLGDISVVNGTPISITDNDNGTFTVKIESAADGIVHVHIAAGTVQDLAGNHNVAAEPYAITVAAIKVSLDASGLHIEDLRGDPQDLTIQSDPTNGVLVIKGGGKIAGLAPDLLAQATGDGTTQVTLPLELLTGRQIIVTTQSGADSVTLGPLMVDADVLINTGSGVSNTITFDDIVSTRAVAVTAANISIDTTSITTTAGQNYNGAVSLGADTILTSGTTATFSDAITGNGRSLTIAGSVTFGGTVNEVGNLDVTGFTAINSPTIVTNGDQHFRGDVTLGIGTRLTAGGGLTFDANIDSVGSTDLAIAGGGPALFRGNQFNVGAITIDASEIEFDETTGAKTLTATGSVLFVTGRDVFMNTLLVNSGDNITVIATTGIYLGQLVTPGDVRLESSAGGIADGNPQGVDISADRLLATAATGIGTAIFEAGAVVVIDPLETAVRVVDVIAHGIGAFIDNVPPVAGSQEGESHPWHNAENPFDVDDDGHVSPLDVLQIVNYLNGFGSHALAEGESTGGKAHRYVDVNADDFATPLDALLVINYLNAQTTVQAESESSGGGDKHALHYLTRQLRSNDHTLVEQVLSDWSRPLPGKIVSTSRRPDELPATPPVLCESFHVPRDSGISREGGGRAREWESLLDEIANDMAAALSARV